LKSLFTIVVNAVKIPDLRKKILITLLLVIIFRIGCFIAIPGLEADALTSLAGNGLFRFMDLLTGSAFRNISLFAMGISPYINASIIMQLLTVAIPALEKLQKEGQEGRKVITKITRYVALGLGLFQAIMLYIQVENFTITIGNSFISSAFTFLLIVISFTTGTAVLVWLGEKITEVGIGNGISMIIFAGIVANAPSAVRMLYGLLTDNSILSDLHLVIRIVIVLAILIVFLAVIMSVVWMEGGERRIPVQYAKRVVGRKIYGGQNTHIPLRVNSSGVLPIIFAMSMLQFPATIVAFTARGSAFDKWLTKFNNSWWYLLLYAVLIVAFTFFYNMVYFDPVDIANNLKKNGGFIPGLRPGRPTAEFIKNSSRKITTFGAFFLAVLAVLPSFLQKISSLFYKNLGSLNLWFGGTTVLILVGVALETVRQLESQMLMRHYKGFLE